MYKNIKLARSVYATEEHQLFQEVVQGYIKKHVLPHREKWEEQGYCDKSAWLEAGKLGLLNLTSAPEYGGGGLDFSFAALMIEEASKMGLVAPGFSMHSDIAVSYTHLTLPTIYSV